MKFLTDILARAGLTVEGVVTLNNTASATVDTDKFVVLDGSVVKTRTGTQILSDIAAAPAAAGVPTGGTSGQVLAKNSSTNYDTIWVDSYNSYAVNLQHPVKAGEAITKGQAVYVSSADGTNMIVSKASNAGEGTSSKTMGLIDATVSTNGFANVITEGLLAGLNTAAAAAGDPVWLGTSGDLIFGLINKPIAPAHLVFIGVVTRANANNGEIFVKVQNGFELEELHNVYTPVSGLTNNDILTWEASTSLWKNKSISTILGYTPVTNARTLTINGTAYDLTANRSWSVGTVTSVAALTIGTTGTDITSTIANSTTTPVITLNIPDASASARGVVTTSAQTFAGAKTFSSTVAVNHTSPYDTTQFSLDVNGGLLVKNVGKTAQFVLINANPASGGNAAFVMHTVGGTSSTSYVDIQGYYGASVAGSTVIRLNNAGGNVLIGSLTGTGTRMVVADATGVLSTQAVQTISSLGGVPTTRTLTINGTAYDLSADRSWSITSMIYPAAGIAVSTGTAWGTSITDNSSNWNTAYGWGNHASGGYLTSATAATTYVSLTGSYANPAWITSLAYSKITGVPAFLTSYTETDTLATVTGRGNATTSSITVNGDMNATGIVYSRANQTTAYTSAALWTQSFGSTLTGIAFHVSGVVGRMLHMNASATDGNLYWNNIPLVYNSGTWGINITGSAGSVAWGNITSKPGDIMYYAGFTLNADSMPSNSTGFTYSDGAPLTGPIVRFSTGGGYDLQINAPYYWGNEMYFRVRNGDLGVWRSWKQLLNAESHSYAANMNQYVRTTDDVSFAIVRGTSYMVTPTIYSGGGNVNFGNNIGLNGNNAQIQFKGAASEDLFISAIPGTRTIEIRNGNAASPNYAACGLITGYATFTGNISAANFSGSSSGSNTGDQTNISGSAGSAGYADRIQTGNNQWTWTTGAHTATNPNTITLWDQYSNYGGAGYPWTYGTIVDIYGRSAHEHDQFFLNSDGQMFHRNCFYGTNTWNGWRTMLDSSNYNSYSPTLTGGGASGTWGIAISGNSATSTTFSTGRTNYKGNTDNAVAGQLMWKQYGNNHTIFDASNGTSPDGTTISRHTPQNPVATTDGSNSWGVNPNLMGWNGSSTFGVKVDWSRYSESAGLATQVVTIQDAPPSGSAGKLWWESDTGKLKVYYGSAWIDASPIPDSSLFFAKAGGSITGDVSIGQTLNVVGNTLVQGTIYSFGDVIAYSSSDARLKDNITVIDSPLEKLSKINGVSFNWNDKQSAYEVGKKDIGVIAQEIEEVLPELVTTRDNGYKAVRYEKIVPLLIEAIKEQQSQIDELKGLINKLTDKLNIL